MQQDIEEVLITEAEIKEKCQVLGKQLTEEYEGTFPLVIGVLKGATLFMSDITRSIETHVEIDFMDVSSYGSGVRSSGEVKIEKDLDASVEVRDIIIIEDIIDSGLTLSYLVDYLNTAKQTPLKSLHC